MACRRDTGVSKEVRKLDETRADRTVTLTAFIQAARSAEVMLLHSFLTLGDLQAALAETRNREESNTTRRTSRKAIPEQGEGTGRRSSAHGRFMVPVRARS